MEVEEREEDGWKALNKKCREATGFFAGVIALSVWARELDPDDDAPYDPDGATEALANLLGSSGDATSRAAAAAILFALCKAGYAISREKVKPMEDKEQPETNLSVTMEPAVEVCFAAHHLLMEQADDEHDAWIVWPGEIVPRKYNGDLFTRGPLICMKVEHDAVATAYYRDFNPRVMKRPKAWKGK